MPEIPRSERKTQNRIIAMFTYDLGHIPGGGIPPPRHQLLTTIPILPKAFCIHCLHRGNGYEIELDVGGDFLGC